MCSQAEHLWKFWSVSLLSFLCSFCFVCRLTFFISQYTNSFANGSVLATHSIWFQLHENGGHCCICHCVPTASQEKLQLQLSLLMCSCSTKIPHSQAVESNSAFKPQRSISQWPSVDLLTMNWKNCGAQWEISLLKWRRIHLAKSPFCQFQENVLSVWNCESSSKWPWIEDSIMSGQQWRWSGWFECVQRWKYLLEF